MTKKWSTVLVLAVVGLLAGVLAPAATAATAETPPAATAPGSPPAAVVAAACVNDGHEPNNTFATATPLTSGVPLTGQICMGDRDFFALSLTAGTTIRADLLFSHAVGDLDLFLYSPDGQDQLASSDGKADNEHVVHTITETGTHYLIVRSPEEDEAPYTLSFGPGVPCTEDAYEPNDDEVEATSLPVNTTRTARICTANVDWYSFSLGAGAAIEVDLTFSSAEGNLDLALLDPYQDPLASATDGVDGEHIEYTVEDAGTYYLVVSGFDGAAAAYTLRRMAGAACVDDGLEPDDGIGEGTPLAIDTPVAAKICPYDRDFFALTLGAGDTIEVDLTFVHASGDLNLWLLDDGGEDIAGASSTDDDEHLAYTVPTAGTYYLEVYGAGPATTTYTLEYTEGEPCDDDGHEPNDEIGDATALALGATVAGTACAGNRDLFEVVVSDGDVLTIDLQFAAADGDLDLYLRNAAEGIIASSEGTDDDELIEHSFTTGGTFYIEVFPYEGFETPYQLTASIDGAVSDCGPPPEPGVFPDVPGTHPFCRDIEWLVLEEVTTGFPDGNFRPTADVTRQSMAAFIYRYSGSPAFTPPATPTFSDVPTDHVFYAEIEWAVDVGIAEGFADGTFAPGRSITRGAMAAFLYRLAGEPAFTPPAEASFSDVPTSHPFFAEIEWMAEVDVTGGYDDGTFRPAATVTRQAMAAFLHRFDDLT